ncbi:MAG: hypothetical protein KAR20_05935 [Candidatus Heimdallarchaeota archaeon]|nr:hypothetical protein [Candidatus Heimdallarchaeota archaeon]
MKKADDLSVIASSINRDMKQTATDQRKDKKGKEEDHQYFFTGIDGFDELIKRGIPKNINILIEGNAGSGKTIFSLQMLNYHASKGKKCLFISFEESEEQLIQHMESFGWDPRPLISSGNLVIKRQLTNEIYYNEDSQNETVQAMMAKNSDYMLLDLEPFVIGEDGFKPDIAVIDSLTAISSSFLGKDKNYRFYIERLFRFFEHLGSTNFLITEPSVDMIQSQSERFLADGIIVLYNARRGNIRENAIEILKLRGAPHEKRIVAMKITDTGLVVYPDQEVFAEIEE